MYRLYTICGKGKRKMEEIRWYEKLNYTETKDIIKEKLQNMSRDFVAIGFYLKLIRDKSLYFWKMDINQSGNSQKIITVSNDQQHPDGWR